MHPFTVIVIFFIVFWILGGIASAGSKKKELERRRRIAEQMGRVTASSARPVAQAGRGAPPRQIARGLAARFPQVLPPPVPKRKAVRRAVQSRPALQGVVKHIAAPFAPIHPTAVTAPTRLAPVTPPQSPAPVSPVVRSGATSADAIAIARWLKPQTLRQQFILTEILRGPLAERSQPPGDLI